MRELTMAEIEVVSGAGWSDWFGGVSEQVQNFMDKVVAFFSSSNIPDGPSPGQREAIDKYCRYGLQSATFVESGGSASLSINTVGGAQISLTRGGGTFSFSCLPPHP